MNVNFEAIEKAWFKPKKNVLDELEEYLKYRKKIYKYEKLDFFVGYKVCCIHILDKIQELKKETK